MKNFEESHNYLSTICNIYSEKVKVQENTDELAQYSKAFKDSINGYIDESNLIPAWKMLHTEFYKYTPIHLKDNPNIFNAIDRLDKSKENYKDEMTKGILMKGAENIVQLVAKHPYISAGLFGLFYLNSAFELTSRASVFLDKYFPKPDLE